MQNKNISRIGKKSNNNIVVQIPEINITNTVNSNGLISSANILAKAGQYKAIDVLYQETIKGLSKTHPLSPLYGVKAIQENGIQRLVSTPLIEEALKRYPQNVKSIVQFHYKDYPGYNKKETIWNYAYRTQREVQLDTKSYKEYLGDIEDPFPIIEYEDGMKLKIVPPQFPESIEITLKAGLVVYNTYIRRIPCDEYNLIQFSNNEDEQCSFSILFTLDKEKRTTKFTINRRDCMELEKLISREELIIGIRDNRMLVVAVDNKPLMCLNELPPQNFEQDFFVVSDANLRLYKSLRLIESYMDCKFNLSNVLLNNEDYYHSVILASSLKTKWQYVTNRKSLEVFLDYDKIDLGNDESDISDQNFFVYETYNYDFNILGISFTSDSIITCLRNIRIINYNSVKRKIQEHNKRIKIIFEPLDSNVIMIYKYINNPHMIIKE